MVTHLVFVFGTLKEGCPNFATNRGTRVPGRFRTRQPLPLYLVGERQSPWLLDAPGEGRPVAGQVFEVGDEVLADMDRLERVTEPDGYRRVPIEVCGDEPRQVLQVQAYLKPPALFVADAHTVGPLAEYTLAHAARYRPRRG